MSRLTTIYEKTRKWAAWRLPACLLALLGLWAEAPAVELPMEVDGIFARYVKLGEELEDVMARVRDRSSADARSSALQALLARVGESRREIGALPRLSADVAEAVTSKYEKQMREVWGRVYESIYRLQRVRCYESVPFFRSFSILCSLLES